MTAAPREINGPDMPKRDQAQVAAPLPPAPRLR